MEILTTIGKNWFTLLQSIGIVGSLLLATISYRESIRTKQAETFLTVATRHQKIWRDYYQTPALSRIREELVDLDERPISIAERRFVQSVILHVNAVFQAQKLGSLIIPEGAENDIRTFFSLPIPRAVYEDQKSILDRAFVAYVDAAIEDEQE